MAANEPPEQERTLPRRGALRTPDGVPSWEAARAGDCRLPLHPENWDGHKQVMEIVDRQVLKIGPDESQETALRVLRLAQTPQQVQEEKKAI